MKMPTETDITQSPFVNVRDEQLKMGLKYPLNYHLPIPEHVYVNEQQFNYWNVVSKYLPAGCSLTKGYVPGDVHAIEGLNLLKEKNPSFDFSSIVSLDFEKAAEKVNDDYFKQQVVSKTNTFTRTNKRTNPELNGKFGDYYLFQFDYEKVSVILNGYGIIWDLPGKNIHQKGIALDITTTRVDEVYQILKWFETNNPELNVSGRYETDQKSFIRVFFKDNPTYVFPHEYGILNVASENNLSDFFDDNTTSKIYKILKDHSYGNLDESVSGASLSAFPAHVRRKGTNLANALSLILQEVLGGSNGVISVFQQDINAYLMAIINGLTASNKLMAEELDRIGGGDVSSRVTKAFESGLNKKTVKKSVKTVLNNGMEINKATSKAMSNSQVQADSANIMAMKEDMSISRNNQMNENIGDRMSAGMIVVKE
jgi:hypothetical protein